MKSRQIPHRKQTGKSKSLPPLSKFISYLWHPLLEEPNIELGDKAETWFTDAHAQHHKVDYTSVYLELKGSNTIPGTVHPFGYLAST